MQFLGITDLLLLRGDKAKEDRVFTPTPGGHAHTTDLIRQVQRFNEGFFANGEAIKNPGAKFDIGVACYPEKHEEAPNLEMDMQYLKEKQDLGAQYAVTQLFYDNEKYFAFLPLRYSRGTGPRDREVQDGCRCSQVGRGMDREAVSGAICPWRQRHPFLYSGCRG